MSLLFLCYIGNNFLINNCKDMQKLFNSKDILTKRTPFLNIFNLRSAFGRRDAAVSRQ